MAQPWHDSVIVTHDGPYLAVSYDSSTFEDLVFFMTAAGATVERIDPDEFLALDSLSDVYCMNLVTRFPLRQQISQHLDKIDAKRFSCFACPVPYVQNAPEGCFFYPNVSIYPSAKIDHDVIIHSNTTVGHSSSIAHGCFISAQICIAGSTNIGPCCWIGAAATIADKITLAPNTEIMMRSIVTQNITTPNTVYKKHVT
jgi:acetyltransferase-like isoleucine patch superfamily enzyme